ncbi:MAG: transcription antitermination factor NusB [Dehalococcoidia bacterium]
MAKLYRRARVRAFQALFEADFGRIAALDALRRSLPQSPLSPADRAYAETLVCGVTENAPALDRIIAETAPAWPVEQIAVVDRTVLRIALYELLLNNAAVPTGAAINEAVDLAKTFGSNAGRRFVNGVLGTVSRERLSSPVAQQAETEEPGGPV